MKNLIYYYSQELSALTQFLEPCRESQPLPNLNAQFLVKRMIEYGISQASFRHHHTTKNTLLIIFEDLSMLPIHTINILFPPFFANKTVLVISTTALTFVFSHLLPHLSIMLILQEVFSKMITFNGVFRRGTSSFRQQKEKHRHRTGLGDKLNFNNLPQANVIHLLD